jgi:UDP-2,4-diacetamido-2,4,6-trideoxy-beta-L-altropyranose hydrolase
MATEIKLRPVTMADAPQLLVWRNEATTLANSYNSNAVGLDDHIKWLKRVLRSDEHVLRIAEFKSEAIGVVRADRTKEGWLLSWTVSPGARTKGLGRNMLDQFVQSLKGPLIATIRRDNVASQRMASAVGMRRCGPTVDPKFEHWIRS